MGEVILLLGEVQECGEELGVWVLDLDKALVWVGLAGELGEEQG